MSNYYRELREPISSVKVMRETAAHVTFGIWVNGKKAGDLTFGYGEHFDFLNMIAGKEVAQTYGKREGVLLKKLDRSRTDCLIDDYGNIVSIGDLVNGDSINRDQFRVEDWIGHRVA